MRRTMMGCLVAVGMFLALPGVGSAQSMSLKDVQVADLEGMKQKFTSLGAAFSPDQLDWRPMEGTRSIREELALIAAEGHFFPTMWGFDAPERAAGGFGPEMARVTEMSQEDMVEEIGMAMDHFIELVQGMDEATRMKEITFFGRQVTQAAAVTMAANDMHEHLGKLISNARANEVVPPWSR